MYGLWLYKEFATEYGKCRLEIHQKDYSGQSEEIEAFAADSLRISLDNLSEIISPVGKTVCSFDIIHTNQFDYDVLFTPDATKFMVVIKTQAEGEEWQTRWGGFITPDFFAENLEFRSLISITARDNIGYLNDIPFSHNDRLISVGDVITQAFNKISAEYPMQVVFESAKLIDTLPLAERYVSAKYFSGKSCGEVLETILHDFGLQMRWMDNNTIKVFDLSAMPEKFSQQPVFFINRSGYREILPAWRELAQDHKYEAAGNLYDGVANADLMVLDHTEQAIDPERPSSVNANYITMYYYKLLSSWSTAWNAYTAKDMNNPLYGVYIGKVNEADKTQDYIAYSKNVNPAGIPLNISFKMSKTLHYNTREGYMKAYDIYNFFDKEGEDYLQLNMFVSVLLYGNDGKTYYLSTTWKEYTEDNKKNSVLKFLLNKATPVDYGNEEVTIISKTVPVAGRLEIRLHGFSVADFKYYNFEGSTDIIPEWNKYFARVDEVAIQYDTDAIPSDVTTAVLINEKYNIKRNESYSISTLVEGIGGESVVVNGVYDGYGNTLFHAQIGEETYKLMELVGREAIHYNSKNFEKRSGNIKASNFAPLRFDSCFSWGDKTFIPYSYSLSLISNTMNITAMQEVVPYEVQNFADIQSAISTDGATSMAGGDNLALQYSGEVGNAKRIYELETATEQDYEGAYVVIDKPAMNQAKKLSVENIVGQSKWFEERTSPSGQKYLYTNMTIATQGDVVAGSTSDVEVPPQIEVEVDSEMSDTSENPAQNKVVKAYVDELRDAVIDGEEVAAGALCKLDDRVKYFEDNINNYLLKEVFDNTTEEIVNEVLTNEQIIALAFSKISQQLEEVKYRLYQLENR